MNEPCIRHPDTARGLVQIHAANAPMAKRSHIDLRPRRAQPRERDHQLPHFEDIGGERRANYATTTTTPWTALPYLI